MFHVSEPPDPDVRLIRMGRVSYRHAARLMERLAAARRHEQIGDTLLLVEHPPVLTMGCAGGVEDLRVTTARLHDLGLELIQTGRGGRMTYHGPGQLVAYPIMRLPDNDLHAYAARLEQVALEVLAAWGLAGKRLRAHPGVWLNGAKIAAIGIAVADGVTSHGLALNVDPNLEHFQLLNPCGLERRGVTSLRAALGHAPTLEQVEQSFVSAFARVFNCSVGAQRRMGAWLVAPAAQAATRPVERLVDDLSLHTVCQAAACPNLGECWSRGTATFMLLGDRCTRHCRFCNVAPGRPRPPDPLEPARVATAAARLGLEHVVLTSVARDDLPDGGAGHFAATIGSLRQHLPHATVEVLVPDFGGAIGPLQVVAEAHPDVFNHNLETVERLSERVRAKATYRRSLAVLAWARQHGLTTKSGLMLGLGESCGEVITAMRDLRRAGCSILTLGQYLQPTSHQLEVAAYLPPTLFDWYRELALGLGFQAVAAGPLVRSSYHAEELWLERTGSYAPLVE